jgi:hypothetical protein
VDENTHGEKVMEMADDIDAKLDDFMKDEGLGEPMPDEEPQAPKKEPSAPPKDDMEDPSDYEIGELSDAEQFDVQLKPEDKTQKDGKVISNKEFVIESVGIQQDKIRQLLMNKEPFVVFNDKKPDQKGYQTRLQINYADSTYVSLIPAIRWYPTKDKDTGKNTLVPWFSRIITEDKLYDPMTSTISKLYFRYCKFVGQEVGKVTQKEFLEGLVGKKVVLEEWETMYNGKKSYRLDIREIVA